MFQKRQDRVGSNVVEGQTCNRLVLMVGKEQEEEFQRVAVGSHGVATRTACLAEILLKEVLCRTQQRLRVCAAHRMPSPLPRYRRRRRLAARPNNSGVAFK